MSRLVVFVCFLLMLAGCRNDREIPKDILPMERMGDLLFQVTVADAYLENYTFKDSLVNRDSAIRAEMDKLFLVNKVTAEQFRTSYSFYKQKPVLFREMIDTVHARTLRNQEKIYNRRPRGKGNKIALDTTERKSYVPRKK